MKAASGARNAARSLCILLVVGCGREAAATPSPECTAAWSEPASAELVALLEQATAADRMVWTDYYVGDAAFVLNAGPSDSGGFCLGLWQDGSAVSFVSTAEEPSLLTPLYGYYFDANWYDGVDADMLDRSTQPAPVTTWLESQGVRSAIVLPVAVPDFPMVLPALVKVQLAMHEAFHVDVQAPRWYASTGNWPIWDRQPDRVGLDACYTAGDDVVAALEAEREHLVSLVENLLDGDTTRACDACRSFLEQRSARYELLSEVRVARHDSTPGTCAQAEAIMELEEGTADYASWTVLYDLGLASRESLIRRYRAVQKDVFYLTGAMQLHAVQLMYPDSMADVMTRIAHSQGPEDGSPAAVLARALASFCAGRAEGAN